MRLGPAVELAAWCLAMHRPAMHGHLQAVVAERGAGALHCGHRYSHRTRDVPILQPSLRVVLISAEQDLRSLPLACCGLARRGECFEFLSFLNAEFDAMFFMGHPCSTVPTHHFSWT